MIKVTIPDEHGFFWDLPRRLIDWTNRLELRESSGPDYRIDVVLAEFDSLPGETRDVLKLFVKHERESGLLVVTVQGGHWVAEPTRPRLSKEALYRTAVKNLIYLPCWRGMGKPSQIKVFAPADPYNAPYTERIWAVGHDPVSMHEVAHHFT